MLLAVLVYVIVNILSYLIVYLLFLGMVMYAN